MATVAPPRHTPEELLEITDRPMPELVDGEILERMPMGQESDAVGCRLIAFLGIYAQTILPGIVNGAQGSFQIFPDDPNKVRIPDVSFTRRERMAGGRAARGHARIVPDLVAEVISPNDSASKVARKIRDFLNAGVPMILVIDPDGPSVQVIRGDGTARFLYVGDMIDGGDVLPGFTCPVASLFG